jgi:hypothetical protein
VTRKIKLGFNKKNTAQTKGFPPSMIHLHFMHMNSVDVAMATEADNYYKFRDKNALATLPEINCRSLKYARNGSHGIWYESTLNRFNEHWISILRVLTRFSEGSANGSVKKKK